MVHPAASPSANTLILSFLLVFFGIRSYHDNVGQGQITFARDLASASPSPSP